MALLCVLLLSLVAGGTVFADLDTLVYRERQGEPSATAALVAEFRRLSPVRPPNWQNLKAEWTFALGDPNEGLNTSLDRLPENRVKTPLPHRILAADTPYWYVTEVNIAEPSVLSPRADDGAQLYVDGKRVPIEGDVFPVPPSNGKTRLVVRVINKALYGGLDSIRITSQQDHARYRKESEVRARLSELVRKTRLLLSPTPEEISAVEKAARAGNLDAIQEAEKRLSVYPLTVIGPYLQTGTADRMTIVWETDVPCDATLEWGEDRALTRKVAAQNEGNLHIAQLDGLKPAATYSYRIHSGSVISSPYVFRALPTEGAFEFTAWADSQNSWDVFRQNVNLMRRMPLAFMVGVGDLVEDAYRPEPWRGFFDTLSPLASEVPAMLVAGNHDYDGCFEDLHTPYFDRYARNRPKPQYFAWTAGNARFVALDPNETFPTGIPEGSAQRKWFLQELESPEWKRATWHFVFLHQPPYSQGWAEYHGDIPIREMLEPLIEKHGIDFIVSGHTHDYERWTRKYGRQTVHFLIVGGGGGGLEDEAMSAYPVMDKVIRRHHVGRFRVDGKKVTFEAVATDARVLDRLTATK